MPANLGASNLVAHLQQQRPQSVLQRHNPHVASSCVCTATSGELERVLEEAVIVTITKRSMAVSVKNKLSGMKAWSRREVQQVEFNRNAQLFRWGRVGVRSYIQ